MGNYKVYTDGACSGNPGVGGYSAIILDGKGNELLRISGGSEETTNNNMELKAIVRGLEHVFHMAVLKEVTITVFSDSAYCLNPLNLRWIDFWKKNGWKTKEGNEIKNVELWKKLDELITSHPRAKIQFIKVKGHDGVRYNELADKLAKVAIQRAKRGKSL